MIAGWLWNVGVVMLYIVIGTQRETAKRCETLYKMISLASIVVKADLQIDSISIFLFVEVVSKTREPFPITIETKAHIKE